MQYRTDEELRYYGSDYNKYLSQLSRKMTVINIDCLQYKRSKRLLRIVESKHLGEKTKQSQREVLHLLAIVLGYCNNIAKKLTFQLYVVTGNYPYEKLQVENLITGTKTTLSGDDVRRFSELDLSP